MIKAKDAQGNIRKIDLVKYMAEYGNVPTKAQGGLIEFRNKDGEDKGVLNISEAMAHFGLVIEDIDDGLNSPETALATPPQGYTMLDQTAVLLSGNKLDDIKRIFPRVEKIGNRIVVLDQDNLWRTMSGGSWEDQGIEIPETYDEKVAAGKAPDLRILMRGTGLGVLLSFAGIAPKNLRDVDQTITDLISGARKLSRVVSLESKTMLMDLFYQTTGVERWKGKFLIDYPNRVDNMLREMTRDTAIQARTKQISMAEMFVQSLYEEQSTQFASDLNTLKKTSKLTSEFDIDLKPLVDNFFAGLEMADIIPELERISGLADWAGDNMDEFPSDFVTSPGMQQILKILTILLPVAQQEGEELLVGAEGLDAVITLDMLLEDAIVSCATLPQGSGKLKTVLLLRDMQSKLESILSDQFDDGKGHNEFMDVKSLYKDKRELILQLVQTPKQDWPKVILKSIGEDPNLNYSLSQFSDETREVAELLLATEVAFDLRPIVDIDYEKRMDAGYAFADMGEAPPEMGFLAKHSPRVVMNIVDKLSFSASAILNLDDRTRKEYLRNPIIMNQLLKMVSDSAVAQEMETQGILKKVGMDGFDSDAAPDARRLFQDPEQVVAEKGYEDLKAKNDQAVKSQTVPGQVGDQEQGGEELSQRMGTPPKEEMDQPPTRGSTAVPPGARTPASPASPMPNSNPQMDRNQPGRA